MPIDEAAAVEAMARAICEKQFRLVATYPGEMFSEEKVPRWVEKYWRNDIPAAQAALTALAALKPFLGGILREKLEHRIAGITEALTPQLVLATHEQKHLDNGSVERTYWHYGYMVALKDVLKQLPPSPDKGGE